MKLKFNIELNKKYFNETIEIFIDDTTDAKGVSNIEKALWLEYGQPEKNAPIRPFWSIGTQLIEQDNQFKSDIFFKELDKAGETAVYIIQETMESYDFLELKDSTIKGRQSRGNYSTQPTVDTGALRDSVTFKRVKSAQ